jgi:hypothetical protein
VRAFLIAIFPLLLQACIVVPTLERRDEPSYPLLFADFTGNLRSSPYSYYHAGDAVSPKNPQVSEINNPRLALDYWLIDAATHQDLLRDAVSILPAPDWHYFLQLNAQRPYGGDGNELVQRLYLRPDLSATQKCMWEFVWARAVKKASDYSSTFSSCNQIPVRDREAAFTNSRIWRERWGIRPFNCFIDQRRITTSQMHMSRAEIPEELRCPKASDEEWAAAMRRATLSLPRWDQADIYPGSTP